MKDSKGSTLAIAVSMVFLFAALGAGMINYAGGQRQFSNYQTRSTQAFWLADAGLQSFCSATPPSPLPFTMGAGTFDVTASGNLLTSTGTVDGKPVAKREIQADCIITDLFKAAIFTAGNMVLNGNITTNSYNSTINPNPTSFGAHGDIGTLNGNITASNGSAVVVNGAISTGSTGTVLGDVVHSGTLTHTNTGTLVPITLPSALTSASCPGGGTFWNITNNTTFAGSGNFQCDHLQISGATTLTIKTPVVLYLTGAGEDLVGTGFPQGGIIQIMSGGSLTIYAQGRLSFGAIPQPGNPINVPSNIIVLNNTFIPSNFVIYSLYVTTYDASGMPTNGAGVVLDNTAPFINGNTVKWYGLLDAPQASVYAGEGQTIFGAMIGNTVTVDTGTVVHYDQASLIVTYSLTNWMEVPVP